MRPRVPALNSECWIKLPDKVHELCLVGADRMGRWSCWSFVLLLVVFGETVNARRGQFQDSLCFSNLKPPAPPRVICQGEGGTIEVWEGEALSALNDAQVVAARITLRPGGLMMPSYLDVPAIKIVIQGSLRVGINNPWSERATQENAYKLKEGDVVAIPEGVANWWYNDCDEDAIILCVADTRNSPNPGTDQVYLLAGGKDKLNKNSFGSALKGFSTKFLAQMWDVSEDMVRTIVNSQQQSGMIRVPKGMNLPDIAPEVTTGLTMDYIYHHADAYPDYKVEQGGELRELNSLKMPILESMKMAAECVKLLQDAMVVPNWFHSGHQVIYVQSGSGRLQVANNVGDRVLDMELQEGSLVVVPRFFPSTKVAGAKGLKYVSVVTSDRPIMSYLGGYNSIYSGLPLGVISTAFNIDEQTAKKLQQGRSKKAIIVPPKQTRRC